MTDSPVPVSVITAKDLSNASVTSLDEALQKLTPSCGGVFLYLSLIHILIGNLPIASNETVVLDYPINIMRIYICRYIPGFTPGSLASGYVIARLLIPLQR